MVLNVQYDRKDMNEGLKLLHLETTLVVSAVSVIENNINEGLKMLFICNSVDI